MTITIPEWMIGMFVAMWMVSTALKIIIWRLEKRLAK